VTVLIQFNPRYGIGAMILEAEKGANVLADVTALPSKIIASDWLLRVYLPEGEI
jgi:hypothetical protein